MHDGKSSCWP